MAMVCPAIVRSGKSAIALNQVVPEVTDGHFDGSDSAAPCPKDQQHIEKNQDNDSPAIER
jgi:hypothetical protein